MCMPRQHPKRFEYQTSTRPPKWVNSNSNSSGKLAAFDAQEVWASATS